MGFEVDLFFFFKFMLFFVFLLFFIFDLFTFLFLFFFAISIFCFSFFSRDCFAWLGYDNKFTSMLRIIPWFASLQWKHLMSEILMILGWVWDQGNMQTKQFAMFTAGLQKFVFGRDRHFFCLKKIPQKVSYLDKILFPGFVPVTYFGS